MGSGNIQAHGFVQTTLPLPPAIMALMGAADLSVAGFYYDETIGRMCCASRQAVRDAGTAALVAYLLAEVGAVEPHLCTALEHRHGPDAELAIVIDASSKPVLYLGVVTDLHRLFGALRHGAPSHRSESAVAAYRSVDVCGERFELTRKEDLALRTLMRWFANQRRTPASRALH